MTKIDIISGFLGAGKTTLIKKLIAEGFQGEKIVLIENEFGEIGIDGGFLKDAGVQINEMNSGCICCSLVGDFGKALKQVLQEYAPDRIVIEPSGVGKLSDVIKAVSDIKESDIQIHSASAVVDATKCKMYMKNFGEFFNNQIENAGTIILSRSQKLSDDKLQHVVDLIREKNENATIITTSWDDIDGKQIVSAMERDNSFVEELMKEAKICPKCGHEHHHHEGECCHEEHHHHEGECCHEEHHHHEGECCHEEHHHHEGECCHEEHHHHEGECCHEGHHHHEGECCHEGHHHADEVFTSWGVETPHKYTKETMEQILKQLSDIENPKYGMILRAKGIVPGEDGEWIYFDLTPQEYEIRTGQPEVTGKLCVIGSDLKEELIEELFQIRG